MSKYHIQNLSFDDVYCALKELEETRLSLADAKKLKFTNYNRNYSLFNYPGREDDGRMYRKGNYTLVVNSLNDSQEKFKPEFYKLRYQMSQPNENTSENKYFQDIPLYMTNTNLDMGSIFTVGVNDCGLVPTNIVPVNGLYIAFYNGEGSKVSELSQIFPTGWIQTKKSYDQITKRTIREGILDLGSQYTESSEKESQTFSELQPSNLENQLNQLNPEERREQQEKFGNTSDDMETVNETGKISNKARAPLFCLEDIKDLEYFRRYGKFPKTVQLLTAETFYFKILVDKLRFCMSVHKGSNIDRKLFIQMRTSFLKYYQTLGFNEQFNKKVLNRIVLFPININRLNPNYYEETLDPLNTEHIIGSLKFTTKDTQTYARNVRNRNEPLREVKNPDGTYAITKQTKIKEKKNGTYMWNFWSKDYLRTTLDNLISEKINFDKMDFDRMTKNYGLDLMANSDASRMKGTHVVVNPEIIDQLMEIDPSRKQYLDNNPDSYSGIFLGKLFPGSNQFLSIYATKVKGKGNEEKTVANVKKSSARDHSLISGNYLRVGDKTLTKKIKVEKFVNNQWVQQADKIVKRSKTFLHHDPSYYDKVSDCQMNLLTAFIKTNDTYKDMTYDQWLNLSPDEFDSFSRSLDGIDCKALISEEMANTSIVRNKKIKLEVYPCNYSKQLRKIIKNLDEEQVFEINVKAKDELLGKVITSKNLRLINEIRCKEEHCNTLMVPAQEIEETVGLKRVKVYQPESEMPIDEHQGFMLCPCCEATQELTNDEIHAQMYSKVEFKKYDVNKFVFCKYEEDEEGITLHIDLHVKSGQSRRADLFTKALPVATGKKYLGYVVQEIKDPETGDLYRYTADLDMAHYPGANKAKMNGIAVAYLTMVNSLFGTKYCPNQDMNSIAKVESKSNKLDNIIASYSNDTEETAYTNALIQTESMYNKMLEEIPPAIRYYTRINPITMQEEEVEDEVYIGFNFSAVTEIETEFSENKTDSQSALFTAKHVDFCYNLGMDSIIESIYRGRTKGENESEYFNIEESLKIAHSDKSEGEYIEGSPFLQSMVVFEEDGTIRNLLESPKDKIDIYGMMKWDDYLELRDKHRLLNPEKKIIKYSMRKLDDNKKPLIIHEEIDLSKGVTILVPVKEVRDGSISLKELRLPSERFFNNKIKPMGDYVKIDDECKEALKMYYTLGAIGGAIIKGIYREKKKYAGGTRVPFDILLEKSLESAESSDSYLTQYSYNRYKKKFKDTIEKKKGEIHEMAAITMPCFNGKVIGSELIPEGTAVVSNRMYSDMVKDYLRKILKRKEISQEEFDLIVTNKQKILDYVLHALSNRDPNVMETQEVAAILRVMPVKQANIMFKDTYGIRFSDYYPGFSSVMLNMKDLVMFQQADADGDFGRLAVPFSKEAQIEFQKHWKKMRRYNEIRNADENHPMYEAKQVQLPWAFKYLMTEFVDSTLDYVKEGPVIFNVSNNIIDTEHVNSSLHQNTQAKGNIAFLMSSMWTLDIVTDYLVSIGELSRRNRKYIQSFYQMVFVQDGCIRAMKGSGELGECTLDNIAIDKTIIIRKVTHDGIIEEEIEVRDLVRRYAKQFTKDHGISIFEDILEDVFFNVVADKWRNYRGFKPTYPTARLANIYQVSNEEIEDVGALVLTLKKITYATSSSFMNHDEFGMYENLVLKDDVTKKEVLPKMRGFSLIEKLYKIVKKLKR